MNEGMPGTVRQPGPLTAIIETMDGLRRRHGPDVWKHAGILLGDAEWDALRASPGMQPWFISALGRVQTSEAEIYGWPVEVLRGMFGTSIVLRGEPGWEKFVAAQGERMARLWQEMCPPAPWGVPKNPQLGERITMDVYPTSAHRRAIAIIAERIA